MGKGLVNLGNLKQSMGIQQDSQITSSFSTNSTPVYIKSATNGAGSEPV